MTTEIHFNKFVAGSYYVTSAGNMVIKAIRQRTVTPARPMPPWLCEVVFDSHHGAQVPRNIELGYPDGLVEFDPVRLGTLYEKVARLSVEMQEHWSDPDYSRIKLEQEEQERRIKEENDKLLAANVYNNPSYKFHVT